MQPEFSSPNEFATYLRFVHESPMASLQSEPNLQFQEIQRAKWAARLNEEATMDIDVKSTHQYIASELWNSLKSCLPKSKKIKLETHLFVGVLDNISVNAICAKSAEGYLVVLINTGLITLFNKLSKILVAINDPGSVIYSNRTGLEPVSSKTLKKWYKEVYEYYIKTGEPLGPQIHLSGNTELLHAMQLNLWEMFVLCHEIGHILCDHLDNKEFLTKNISFGMLETLEENKNHQMEVEADVVGFLLLRKYAKKMLFTQSGDLEDDRPFLFAMITLFDLLFLLGSAKSLSHPHPLDRLCNITEAVYGKSFADKLASSYENNDILVELFEKPICTIKTLEGFLHD